MGTWHQVLRTEGEKVTLGAKVATVEGQPGGLADGQPTLEVGGSYLARGWAAGPKLLETNGGSWNGGLS